MTLGHKHGGKARAHTRRLAEKRYEEWVRAEAQKCFDEARARRDAILRKMRKGGER